ncbi:MAG: hypothetical protein U9Q69_04535 [Nanoarchaeota archaeon]|nr:hypothetical protein [Nanoarchaeota archaeon]
MGIIKTLRTEIIRPTQPGLTFYQLRYVLWFHASGNKNDLGIVAVEYDEKNENYLTLDGHHRIAIAELYGESLEAYVAQSKFDLMKQENFPNLSKDALEMMNLNINWRFSDVLMNVEFFDLCGPRSFKDLRNKYDYMKNLESALKHFSYDKTVPKNPPRFSYI